MKITIVALEFRGGTLKHTAIPFSRKRMKHTFHADLGLPQVWRIDIETTYERDQHEDVVEIRLKSYQFLPRTRTEW